MNALAVSFLYTHLDNLSIAIITHFELGLYHRKKIVGFNLIYLLQISLSGEEIIGVIDII